jgi:long-chain acyl-CoA synthetase
MLTDAYVYKETPITTPLIQISMIAHLLATLTSSDHQRPALTYYVQGKREFSLSYGQLLGEIWAVRQTLQQTYAVRAGSRVGTLCGNCAEVIIFNLAAMSLGAIVVPLNPLESPSALAYIIEHSGLYLLAYNAGMQDKIAALTVYCAAVQVLPIEALTCPATAQPFAASPDVWDTQLAHMAPAVLLYTSGTTGRPKGVTLSHYNLLINAEALKRVHRLDENPVHMCVLPLFHANAWGFSQIGSFYAGIHLILHDSFPIFSFWENVRQERVNICSLIPEFIRLLSRRPAHRETLPDLRYVVSAAAPLAGALAKEFYEKTGIPIHQGYGLSESTNFACTIPFDIAGDRYQTVMHGHPTPSVGTPVYGSQLAVVDHDGQPIAAGVVGEIVILGHANMLGYWQNPAATQAALGDGYLRSGDLGYYLTFEEGDYFFVVGRIKEIIVRAGENISPSAIERELAALQALGEFAVVGFPNDATGEEVGMYLCIPAPLTIVPEMLGVLYDIPFFRRPKVVVLEDAPIPRTSTGKIQRSRLKSAFGDFHSKTFRDGSIVISERRGANAAHSPS